MLIYLFCFEVYLKNMHFDFRCPSASCIEAVPTLQSYLQSKRVGKRGRVSPEMSDDHILLTFPEF